MNKNYNIVGHLLEFHPNAETDDQIFVEDLNTKDPDRLRLLQEWAGGLANPWSDSAMSYVIRCDDRLKVDDEHRWSATFSSIFYDYLESTAVCYAATPEEALRKVREMVEDVIERFAVKDEDEE